MAAWSSCGGSPSRASHPPKRPGWPSTPRSPRGQHPGLGWSGTVTESASWAAPAIAARRRASRRWNGDGRRDDAGGDGNVVPPAGRRRGAACTAPPRRPGAREAMRGQRRLIPSLAQRRCSRCWPDAGGRPATGRTPAPGWRSSTCSARDVGELHRASPVVTGERRRAARVRDDEEHCPAAARAGGRPGRAGCRRPRARAARSPTRALADAVRRTSPQVVVVLA